MTFNLIFPLVTAPDLVHCNRFHSYSIKASKGT
jgi:hypothetical protein